MFRASFQFAICIAIISRSPSFGRKISRQDDEVDIIQEYSKLTPRVRSRYQHSQQPKRDGVSLPEVKCQPHPEVIQVEPDVTSEGNKPKFVTVNRCKGGCGRSLDSHRCSPIKTHQVKVQVTAANGASYPQEVEEHLACACECQPIVCTAHHYPDGKYCRCNCIEQCNEDENQDPTTCACTTRQGKRRDEVIEY